MTQAWSLCEKKHLNVKERAQTSLAVLLPSWAAMALNVAGMAPLRWQVVSITWSASLIITQKKTQIHLFYNLIKHLNLC